MSFNDIIGQDRVILLLKNVFRSNKISHSYLFTGEDSVGKKKTAIEFAKLLNCQNIDLSNKDLNKIDACDECPSCKKIIHDEHPEIRVFSPDGNSFAIAKVREIQKEIQYKQTESKYRVIILEDVQKLTVEAANCFLKTLEEPPKNTILILLATSTSTMLKTIISRCQSLRFKSLLDDEKIEILKNNTDKDDAIIKENLFLAGGNILEASNLLSEDVPEYLDTFFFLEDALFKKNISIEVCDKFESLAKDKNVFTKFIDFLIMRIKNRYESDFRLSDDNIRFFLQIKSHITRNVNPRVLWSWMLVREDICQ